MLLPNNDALLNVEEAAQLLRLHPTTVRNWIRDRKIDVQRVGRRVFIYRSTIEAKLAEGFDPERRDAA